MLLVQKYLQSHSLQELEEEHAVKARICESAPHKFSLNYDQIRASEYDALAKQCRGLVLSTLDGSEASLTASMETKVLAYPFDRFFNYGQSSADIVNFYDPDVRYLEKVDGTCTIVYFDDISGKWCVATRSVPEADLAVDGFGEHTFRTLFEKSLYECSGQEFYEWVEKLDPDCTYVFELTSPLNQIVVHYPGYSVTLLGARHKKSFKEYHPDSIDLGVPVVKEYHLNTISEMLDFVRSLNGREQEGIVCVDSAWRRVKVKNASYVALNKIRDAVAASPANLVGLFLDGHLDDAIPVMPDHMKEKGEMLPDLFAKVEQTYKQDYTRCLEVSKQYDEKEQRKHFALSAKKCSWMGALMQQYSDKVDSFEDYVLQQKKNGVWPKRFLNALYEEMMRYV